MSRSILPSFLRSKSGTAGRQERLPCPLPPAPSIDRDRSEGVSLVELARQAQEAAQ